MVLVTDFFNKAKTPKVCESRPRQCLQLVLTLRKELILKQETS